MRYESSNGLFDISYAAAWELGRLLTLKNQSVAVQIYNWKRASNSRELQRMPIGMPEKVSYLPFARQPANATREDNGTEMPEAIASWLGDLELLKSIPFNYLVPDERLLPVESIRFFWVDSYWVECLQDGAFSIGRSIKKDVENDTQLRQQSQYGLRSNNGDRKITGILLRSQVVSGWQGLLVDGYETNLSQTRSSRSFVPEEESLPLLRMERLSENVLICLFAGEVKTVDIHLKPETMQFGVDSYNTDATKFTKGLRDTENNIDPVPCRDFEQGVINIEEFAKAIKEILPNRGAGSEFTSAQFGLEMIEGMPKVRFSQ